MYMKLQRIYHKIEDFSLRLKCLRGDEYLSLYIGDDPEHNKVATIEQVSFGYSYVADMKMHPYEGRYQDSYAAIDIYTDDKHVFGFSILQIAYLKEMLTSEIVHGMCYFKGGYKEGEIRKHTGRFRVSVDYENKAWCKYYANITFFLGQHLEDDCILCLDKTDVPRLIEALNMCEGELYKILPISFNQE